jgi:hypothetical protein
VPADSGAFRSQLAGREIVNAVLIVGGVAFEKAGTQRITLRADPARVRHETIENRRPELSVARDDGTCSQPDIAQVGTIFDAANRTLLATEIGKLYSNVI